MKMLTKILPAFVLLFAFFTIHAQTVWTIDNAHTVVKFSTTHMVITEIDGEFKKFTGSILSKNDDFTDAKIDFTIDVASINTDNEMRDGHLKSDDFFNATKYPNISFKGISLKKVSGNKYVLEGDLTIRDVTKRVKFDVVYNGTVKDFKGNLKAGFKITGTVNRFDYNLKWNSMVDAGPVVGKDVDIVVNLELAKQ